MELELSMVIPAYNGGDVFEQTIKSVLVRNLPNIEILVVNGGSSAGGVRVDNTAQLLA